MNREFETTALRIVKNHAGVVVSVQRRWLVQDGIPHVGDKMPGPETDYAQMNKGKKFVSQRELNEKTKQWQMVHTPVAEEWRELAVEIDDGVLRGLAKRDIILPEGFGREGE